MTRRLALAALSTLLASCYTIRYERRSALPEPGGAREQWHHSVLGGLVAVSSPVDLKAACPGGVAAVESEVTAGNWIGQFISSAGWSLSWAPFWEPTTIRVTCARATGTRSGKSLRIVLLPLVTLGGVSDETARLLGDSLAGELRRRPGISVLTQSDISALLGVEKTRQMLGCTDQGCIAEIGGALGADRVAHGSLGRVGGSLVVNLSALDPRRAMAGTSVSERLQGGEETFLDSLPSVVNELLADKPPAGGEAR